eukprot:15411292-Alexandrium_andersonii.AAC.1
MGGRISGRVLQSTPLQLKKKKEPDESEPTPGSRATSRGQPRLRQTLTPSEAGTSPRNEYEERRPAPVRRIRE